VAPDKRLSWQYHHRRAEIWQVVKGTVGVITSPDDSEGQLKTYSPGKRIILQKGERHRLVGLNDWGIIAEIWQHTDPSSPSDESDIVRVQDDFGR
jgi:mannose-6-phosphate isomerase-like protein (cupin superfamily)